MGIFPSTTSEGFKFRLNVVQFSPSKQFRYCWEVWREGIQFLFQNQSGTYTTSASGSHSQGTNIGLAQYVDCDPGVYQIRAWVLNSSYQRSPVTFAVVNSYFFARPKGETPSTTTVTAPVTSVTG